MPVGVSSSQRLLALPYFGEPILVIEKAWAMIIEQGWLVVRKWIAGGFAVAFFAMAFLFLVPAVQWYFLEPEQQLRQIEDDLIPLPIMARSHIRATIQSGEALLPLHDDDAYRHALRTHSEYGDYVNEESLDLWWVENFLLRLFLGLGGLALALILGASCWGRGRWMWNFIWPIAVCLLGYLLWQIVSGLSGGME